MEFGQRDASYWVVRLEDRRLSLRMIALRALRELGEGELLLAHGRGQPLLPWALAGTGQRDTVEALRRLEPTRGTLARFLLGPRPVRILKSREACLTALVEADHPVTQYTCAHRLVSLHGMEAVQPLLDCLAKENLREAAAWALGRLGRPILAECLDAYERGGASRRRGILEALWYLGPMACGAEQVLTGKDEWEEAVLLSMGSPVLAAAPVEDRPVWLTRAAIDELARQIFDSGADDGTRAQAVLALAGFGPARREASALLSALRHDPSSTVRLAATSVIEDPEVLLLFADDADSTVQARARKALSQLAGGADLHRALLLPETAEAAAHLLLNRTAHPDEIGPWLASLSYLGKATRATVITRLAWLAQIEALGELAAEVATALVPFTSDVSPAVRGACAEVYGWMAYRLDMPPECRNELADLILSGEPELNPRLGLALTHLGRPEYAVLALGDSNLAKHAQEALCRQKAFPDSLRAAIAAGKLTTPEALNLIPRDEAPQLLVQALSHAPGYALKRLTERLGEQAIPLLGERMGEPGIHFEVIACLAEALRRGSSGSACLLQNRDRIPLEDAGLLACRAAQGTISGTLNDFLSRLPEVLVDEVLSNRAVYLSEAELKPWLNHPRGSIRAMALERLAGTDRRAVQKALQDEDPMVRSAAVAHAPIDLVEPLLRDPALEVRTQAEERLAEEKRVPRGALDAPEAFRLACRLAATPEETRRLREAVAERPELLTSLSLDQTRRLLGKLGDPEILKRVIHAHPEAAHPVQEGSEAVIAEWLDKLPPNLVSRFLDVIILLEQHPMLRLAALRAMGQVLHEEKARARLWVAAKSHDPEVMSLLEELLGPDPEGALLRLKQQPGPPKRSLPPGLERLQDEPDLERHRDRIDAGLHHSSSEVRQGVAELLAARGIYSDRAVSVWLEMGKPPEFFRQFGEEAVLELGAQLFSDRLPIRLRAADTLGHLGPEARKAARLLRPSRTTRISASGREPLWTELSHRPTRVRLDDELTSGPRDAMMSS